MFALLLTTTLASCAPAVPVAPTVPSVGPRTPSLPPLAAQTQVIFDVAVDVAEGAGNRRGAVVRATRCISTLG